MNKDLIVIFCGVHSLCLAVFHVLFWKLFRWKEQLGKLSLPNRAIMQILNIRLIYIFLFIAAICFAFTEELHTTHLGRAVLIGMSLFWLGRTIEQFIFLRINNPYVHTLTVLFILGFVLFLLPVF